MGSPEKPIDLEMGDMSDETKQLNPQVSTDEKPAKDDNEPPRFTGLKKEELLEISSQKKWVVARWILFILFWVGWIGMLVGAIVIVINAPRCKEEPDLPWHQDTVVYEADATEFGGSVDGVVDHLEYVSNLNANTLSLSGAATSDSFKPKPNVSNVVKAASQLKKPMKVIARLRIDVLAITSSKFKTSENCENVTEMCDFFMWYSSSDNSSNLVESSTRGKWYKTDPSDNSLAIINYASQAAKDYLVDAVKLWFTGDNAINGLHITDVANTGMATEVVTLVREAMNASDDNPLGLFISTSASSTSDLEAIYGSAEERYAPVVISNEIGQMKLTAGIGKRIQDSIIEWREGNGNRTVGYSLNPSTGKGLLIDTHNSNMSAAIELLNIALPGIPFLRSGDEIGTSSPTFVWDGKNKVQNASQSLLKAVSATIIARVKSYAVIPSLRWDRDDQHTNLTFYQAKSVDEDGKNPADDVLVFTRRWDKKPTILVLSNLSPSDHKVKLNIPGKKKKVLSASNGLKEDSDVDLSKLSLLSGTTVVVKIE